MIKHISFIFICLLIVSCGGSSKGDLKEVNLLPSIPILTDPANNLLCISNDLVFQWVASSDGNGDAITYYVEIATDNQFSDIIYSASGSVTSLNITLDKGVAYYWRVQATDSQNADSGYSLTYNLYTELEGISNHLPFAPDLVGPAFGASETSGFTDLQWNASDIDGDPLVYDVYFGTDNPPTALVAENQSETMLEVATQPATQYYWKTVVKDGQGGQTIGQVWNFSTN